MLLFATYLLGSINIAILIAKIMHLPDPRDHGSGNPGTTNMYRMGGKWAAILTLLGDTAKGAVPIYYAKIMGYSPKAIAFILIAAVLGHCFSIFLHFKGGKGVATTLGGLFALDWRIGSSWVLTWMLSALLFRYASLASLIAILSTPVYIWLITQQTPYIFASFILSALILYKHIPNIHNLFSKKEPKMVS